MREQKEVKIFGTQTKFKTAQEPSTINWQNKNSNKRPNLRKLIGIFIYISSILVFNYLFQEYA